jgi:uncharacterized protein YjbI with pentapeptide repeats
MSESGDIVTCAAPDRGELDRLLTAHEDYVRGLGGKALRLRGADLRGCNLSSRNLSEADFSGATLTLASLFGSNLTQAKLCCANLQESDLQSAKFIKADLRGAIFKGAKISYARFDGADVRPARVAVVKQGGETHIRMLDRDDESWQPGDKRDACNADFTNCSLKSVSFTGARLEHADFGGAFLQDVDFNGAKLFKASFRGAVLMDTDITAFQLPPEALDGCIFNIAAPEPAKRGELIKRLAAHIAWVESGGRDGRSAQLDGADLRHVRDQFAGKPLIGISARQTLAVGIDFSNSQLQGARFDGADLRGANFSGADLSGVSFRNAKLAHACFDRAVLRKIELISGGIAMPDLTGTEITRRQFESAILDEDATSLGLYGVPG